VLSFDVTTDYAASLHRQLSSSDELFTASDLAEDVEGAKLLLHLQAKIGKELGLVTENIVVQDVTTPRFEEDESEAHIDPYQHLSLEDETSSSDDGYYTIPSQDELDQLAPSELRAIEGFRVGREGFGEIQWLEEVDLRGLDIMDAVSIEQDAVNVYDSENWGSQKPSVGHGLNTRAMVTLEGVVSPDEESQDFVALLKSSIEETGAEFESYDKATSKLMFVVDHF